MLSLPTFVPSRDIRAPSRIPLIGRGRGLCRGSGEALPGSGCRGRHERKMPLGCSEPSPAIKPRVSLGARDKRAKGRRGERLGGHQRTPGPGDRAAYI